MLKAAGNGAATRKNIRELTVESGESVSRRYQIIENPEEAETEQKQKQNKSELKSEAPHEPLPELSLSARSEGASEREPRSRLLVLHETRAASAAVDTDDEW